MAGLVEGEGRSASSLAEKGLMEIGEEESKAKKKKEKGDVAAIVPGASRAVSLALNCVAGRISAREAARALSELAEGVWSGALLLKEEEEAAAKAKAEAAAAAPVAVQQPEKTASFLEGDYEDVPGELSALEAELAALPSAPLGGRAAEKDKVLAEAV